MYAEESFTVLDYKKSLEEFLEVELEKEFAKPKGKIFKSSAEKNIEMISLLKDSINAVYDITDLVLADMYRPSSEIIEALQVLANHVSREELNGLSTAINTDIMAHNSLDKIRQIHELSPRIKKIAEKATLSNGKPIANSIVQVSDRSKSKSQSENFKSVITQFADMVEKSLDKEYGHIDLKQQELPDNYDAQRLINLANSNSLEATMANLKFKSNIQEISKQLVIRDSATKVIEACERLQRELENEVKNNNIDFSRVNKFVDTLLQQKRRELNEANSFLKNYNIDNYLEEAKKIEQTSRENDTKDQIFGQYESIVKEIEELKKKDPNNLDKIHELEERLERIKMVNSDKEINFSEYDQREEKAKDDYKNEQEMQEMMEKERENESAMMREINRSYRESLRKRAINELKLSGDYDNVNREELIRAKIAEISRSEKASDDEFTRRQIKEAENKLMAIAQEELEIQGVFTDSVETIEKKVSDMISQSYMTPDERCREDLRKQGMNEQEITDSLVAANVGYYRDGMSGYEHTKEIQELVQEIGNYRASLGNDYEYEENLSK